MWRADVKEATVSTPGPAENSSVPQTVQQQRRSSRKRNRQEHDGDGNNNTAKPPGKRAGTPHAAPSISRSAKAGELRETPGGECNAAEEEPSVKLKSTRGGRAKGGAKAELAKASGGLDVAAASCDSEGAHMQVKAEPKTSATVPAVAEKYSTALNGAAGAAVHVDQEHDSTVVPYSAEEQWVKLNSALDVLSVAPDDEVVAEIVSLQAELLQVPSSSIPLEPNDCSHVLL
jgi:hypothetical protein